MESLRLAKIQLRTNLGPHRYLPLCDISEWYCQFPSSFGSSGIWRGREGGRGRAGGERESQAVEPGHQINLFAIVALRALVSVRIVTDATACCWGW